MRRAELKVIGGKQDGSIITLQAKKFLIGREQDCQLRPNNESISRHHCVISSDAFSVRIRDLGSTNGTFVNGERIRGQVPLESGDHITVGKLEFEISILQSVEAAVERTSAVSPDAGESETVAAAPGETLLDIPVQPPAETVAETAQLSTGDTSINLPPLPPVQSPADQPQVPVQQPVPDQPQVPEQQPAPPHPAAMPPAQAQPYYPQPVQLQPVQQPYPQDLLQQQLYQQQLLQQQYLQQQYLQQQAMQQPGMPQPGMPQPGMPQQYAPQGMPQQYAPQGMPAEEAPAAPGGQDALPVRLPNPDETGAANQAPAAASEESADSKEEQAPQSNPAADIIRNYMNRRAT